MANHVIYDRLWESKRLRRCSRPAALAYPWIFLVADDHGRFEYDPRRIWTKVFGNRADVTLEEVTAWLSEYEQNELLIRYHIDGDLAYWYNFKGKKPSDRRPSQYPVPPRLNRGGKGAAPGRNGGDEGATKGRSEGDEGALEVEVEVEGEVEQNATDAAAVDRAKIVRGVRCPRSDHELQRETGQYGTDGATKGRGWVCPKGRGGCGAVYVREDPRILDQLTARALEALRREVEAEETAQIKAAEEAAARGLAALEAEEIDPEPAARDLWARVLAHLEASIDRHTFATWFRPTVGMRLDGENFVVHVPKPHFGTWISQNYGQHVGVAMKAAGAGGLCLMLQPPTAPAGARRTG